MNKRIFLAALLAFSFLTPCFSQDQNPKPAGTPTTPKKSAGSPSNRETIHATGCVRKDGQCVVIKAATGEVYAPFFKKFRNPPINTMIEFEGVKLVRARALCASGTPLLILRWHSLPGECPNP